MIIAAIASTAANAAPDWEKLGDRDGVETYGKPIDADGFVSFRGVATLDWALDDVLAAMRDNTTAANWMPMVVERRDLVVMDRDHRIELTRLALPWPCTDRYFIDEARVLPQGDGSVLLTVESVAAPDQAWLQRGLVLGTFRLSRFRLRPTDGRRTELVFEMSTSANGSVPSWLVSAAQQSWPHDLVTGLRGELARREREAKTLASRSST
jgi:hypothetical protein